METATESINGVTSLITFGTSAIIGITVTVICISYLIYSNYRRKQFEKNIEKDLDAVFGSWEDVYACKSLEELSKYADQVTRQLASDASFNVEQLQIMQEEGLDGIMDKANATSFGNIAYIILHAPEEYSQEWRAMLRKIIDDNKMPFKFTV